VKIIDNVYVVPEVVANTYVIVDADSLTLIDAALPRNEKKILTFVASLGRTAEDVKRIILTHSDWDHIGSLARLQKATGARTYAGKIEADAIATGKPSRAIKPPMKMGFMRRLTRLFFSPRPFQVDEVLSDGQVLPILGGLRVIDTAGHTPGHMSLYSPSTGVLFCGDSMVTDAGGIHGSRPTLTWDQDKARAAALKQKALNPRVVCSGHGPVITDPAGKFAL
jgi:glyoxylase-like metal-dependent hydrolase (beta-lactamase superfamily II)